MKHTILNPQAVADFRSNERIRQKFRRNAILALADLSDEDFEKVIEEARRNRVPNPHATAYN